jgi:DNA sulfur modification protein DndD
MIIKSLNINNFRSYYGENMFDFTDGLTLIIGDNGDGKTTFFDAIKWLLDPALEKADINFISEMRKSELEVGEVETVSVSMIFDHDGEKMIEKSFFVERQSEDKFITRSFSFKGYETEDSERFQVTGKSLIVRCFDSFIQRYSMFKGESTLNVFDDPDALKMLVDKLSDIREFDEYVDMTQEFEDKSGTAYEKECKNDKKTEREAKELERRKEDVNARISNIRRDIRDTEKSADLFTSKIEVLEKNQEASERYQELKKLIESREEDVRKLRGRIAAQNFNVNLLDKLWILAPFPSVFEEFRAKASAFSKEKRKQNDAFIAQKAKEEGRKETLDEISSLANGVSRLPWYLPDQETMQEMIDDEICKVCGRPAPKGTDAYDFMVAKLNEFRKHLDAKKKAQEQKPEEHELFINRYIEQMHNLSISLGGSKAQDISELAGVIQDRLDLLETFKRELNTAEEKLQDAIDDKARLLIQVEGVTEEQLDLDFHNLKGYFEQKGKAEKKLVQLKEELTRAMEEKQEIERLYDSLNPIGSMAKVYQRVHVVLRDIAKAFQESKELNLTRFLNEIEVLANKYLSRLNTSDFHGIIRLVRTSQDSTEIRLLSANGRAITDPSGSQLTTMYMSVLFAISDLTSNKRDEDYPLIFDAPTSSFGGMKESGFYNIIDALDKQCIIVTKDFLDDQGRIDDNKINQLTCTVYRIKKEVGFNQDDLSTIRTVITPIK